MLTDLVPNQTIEGLHATLTDQLAMIKEKWSAEYELASQYAIDSKYSKDEFRPFIPYDDQMKSGHPYWHVIDKVWVKKGKETYKHGFDEKGRLRIIQTPYKRYRLFSYDEEGIWEYGAHVREKLSDFFAMRYYVKNEVSTGSAIYYGTEEGWRDYEEIATIKYNYSLDKCTSSESKNWKLVGSQWDSSAYSSLIYTLKDDLVDKVTNRSNDACSTVVFKRSYVKSKLPWGKRKKAARNIILFLTNELPSSIKNNTGDSISGLALLYCRDDSSSSLGDIALIPSSARQKLIDMHPGEETYYAWSPPEWAWGSKNVVGSEFDDKFQDLLMEWNCHLDPLPDFRKDRITRHLLHKVSRKLNRHDFSKHFEITNDFVVTSLDATNEIPPICDMVKCIPLKKLIRLKKKKILPGPSLAQIIY